MPVVFRLTSNVGAFWDKDESNRFWRQKVKVQGHSGSNKLENARLSLVHTTGLNVWGQNVKGQGYSMRHTELDAVRRILISSWLTDNRVE